MGYSEARDRALFLADKMAYELNLTQEQYEAAYEINLDYLMSINDYDDVYSNCWRQRNLDLSYILLDWQYTAFCAASYFYRPIYWDAGLWHFGIYLRYPHRQYFYFSRPSCYVSYRGGHSWRMNAGRSWYVDRGPRFRGTGGPHVGLRDHMHAGGPGRPGMRPGGDRGGRGEVHINDLNRGNRPDGGYRGVQRGNGVGRQRPQQSNGDYQQRQRPGQSNGNYQQRQRPQQSAPSYSGVQRGGGNGGYSSRPSGSAPSGGVSRGGGGATRGGGNAGRANFGGRR